MGNPAKSSINEFPRVSCTNIKLTVAYDGTAYLGWQKTRMGPSIEQCLQKAVEQILQHSTPLQAASRTDAGVHANGQVINFVTSKNILDLHRFQISINSQLPKDIVVLSVAVMPITFHPTVDCHGKEYRYYVCYGPTQLPHLRFYSWHIHCPLNLDLIQKALPGLLGTHHFGAFCNMKKNAHYKDDIRHIENIEAISLCNERFCIRIQGNHFLYKMVRNLVGTLIDVGKEKISLKSLSEILRSQQRSQAGVTAPAHGLFLHEVFYD